MEQALASITTESASQTVHPLWCAAIEHHRGGDTGAAIALYQRYLKCNPRDAAAWLNLGAALRRTRRLDAALVCYQRALRLGPTDAGVWSNLGNLWTELEQHEQSLRAHRRALELAPQRFGLRIRYAAALCEAACFEQAEALIDECIDHEPGRADLLHKRALLRLQQGRYREAWADYDARWNSGTHALPALDSPRWRGERIGGKKLLLIGEPGLGETLWAARYFGMLQRRGAELCFACNPMLHPLFADSRLRLLDGADPSLCAGHFDFHCPVMSLPGLVDPLGLSIPEPPRLRVPDASHAIIKRRIAPYARSFRVGVVWSGSVRVAGLERRALPLVRFLPLAAVPGVQLFSLQKGQPAAQLNSSGARGFIVDIGAQCAHFGDTAAAIELMDLIVTTDSAVAHLAGCLGKPTLNLLQYKPHWIYGLRGDATASYPAMRLIRQESPGNWDGVFDELLRLVDTWADVRLRERAVARNQGAIA